jgi:hypothetical protein
MWQAAVEASDIAVPEGHAIPQHVAVEEVGVVVVMGEVLVAVRQRLGCTIWSYVTRLK